MEDIYNNMDNLSTNHELSDEEVFMGPLTIREIKKHLLSDNCLQTNGCVDKNESEETIIQKSDSNAGLSFPKNSDTPEDSFLKLEEIVSNLSVSPGSECDGKKLLDICNLKYMKDLKKIDNSEINTIEKSSVSANNESAQYPKEKNVASKTPLKTKNSKIPVTPSGETEVFATPSNKLKSKMPVFKTPGNPPSYKSLLGNHTKKYQNIVSPVASYIQKSPVVPFKHVSPKKQFQGNSSIPVKHNSRLNSTNKENCKQESLTQNNAKSVEKVPPLNRQIATLPDKANKLKSHTSKQLSSSIPKAVFKHNPREISAVKRPT